MRYQPTCQYSWECGAPDASWVDGDVFAVVVILFILMVYFGSKSE